MSKYLEERLIQFSGGSSYGQIVFMAGGAGCLSPETRILMFDGSMKRADKIKTGDIIMGPDSTPRNVLNTMNGRQEMLRVTLGTPTRNLGYISNRSHIHTFKASYSKCGVVKGQYYDMTYDEYMQMTPSCRKALVMTHSDRIEFQNTPLEFDPYIVGLWLGDGSRANTNILIGNSDDNIVEYIRSTFDGTKYNFNIVKSDKENVTVHSITMDGANRTIKNPWRDFLTKDCISNGEKTIPEKYLTSSSENRLKLLAGLIDSDGYNGGGYYEIISVFKSLTESVVRLCNGLGFTPRVTIKKVKYNGEIREYNRITISGDDLSSIPCMIERKKIYNRSQIKSTKHHGVTFEPLPISEYNGFQLDGDGRFILENGIVTHNSGKGFVISNFLEGNKFKIRDVDEYKVAFMKLSHTMEKYSELRNLDLRKPGDVFKLHLFVKQLGVKEKSFDNLMNDIFSNHSSTKGTLPNLLFDVTLKDMGDITDVLPYLLNAGYAPKDIHLVWVLTDFNIAIQNNAKRSRVVPEDILLLTHKGAANTMKNLIHGHVPPGLDGRIDIVLNNPENTIWYRSKDGDKSLGVVKDFLYMNVKQPGKAVDHTLDMRKQLFDWINKNTPIHLDSWD